MKKFSKILPIIGTFVILDWTAVDAYQAPAVSHPERVFFLETFQLTTDNGDQSKPETYGWTLSQVEDYSAQVVEVSSNNASIPEDQSLFLRKKHSRYGLSKPLERPFSLDTEQVTIQFEVRFLNQISCSGAYIKFVAFDNENPNPDQTKFAEKTPYVIMFGPDKCGNTDKIHVIFRHQNPVSGEFEEKHMLHAGKVLNDKVSHLYTLQLKKSDQSVRLLVDREEKALNHVAKDGNFKPDFFPKDMIDDPEDIKPSDWEDEKMIPDPDSTKPSDWVKEEFIIDPEAVKPSDWNDDEDGEWEPPKMKNPEYKGNWKAPMIENPKYKGEWAPRQIKNPSFFKQELPLSTLPKISHVFIEVLANDADISFDNIIITEDYETAKEFQDKTFQLKISAEKQVEFHSKLKDKRDERTALLEQEFGFQSVVNYAFGEVYEIYELNKIAFISGLVLLFAVMFYFTCVKKNPWVLSDNEMPLEPASETEEEKEKEAKHKKDDDTEELQASGVTEIPSDKEEEKENQTQTKEVGEKKTIRQRPRRAE